MANKLSKKASSTKSGLKEFFKEFVNEGDRAAVILGAAKLDLQLYQLLLKVLLPNASSRDDLLDGEGPLSTFSAKINMSYRLGLIDSHLAHALHLIRKIRNTFAHEVEGCKLESGSHRERVKELITPLENYEIFTRFSLASDFHGSSGPGVDFRVALAMLTSRLETAVTTQKTLNRSTATALIASHWRRSKSAESSKNT